MPELAALDAHETPSVMHEDAHDRSSLLSSELSFLVNDASQPHSDR